ncbi:Tryptophan synthase beta chain [Halomicronema hongdechloris C2206]|uniref:Tryptophan synthase beta chain n=1 Tax=Halomicronema hongdechloris C2206 TaxID=1641165 RepID=A0A1Z3HRF3_9CYAN|nr:tryptophan synthase subunit beta [Halomicronema hongdechloris]ASC72891.1 Tryptophan synthase beta chain [Halomicronema hongdechloris C2206]
MTEQQFNKLPDQNGYFGKYGGRFVPDTLMEPLIQLEKNYYSLKGDENFQRDLLHFQKTFIGRPTPLYFAENLSRKVGGAKIYFKREDLAHTGAHKINNAIGQILLAKYMGKKRIVAETGAGQHGVATAAASSVLVLDCLVYMGEKDMERQQPNVERMRLMGAEVQAVESGSRTLKDAVSEAMRDWVTNIDDTYYLLGSSLGPHPYPLIVRDFQKVIGIEARKQIMEVETQMPAEVIACLGGGSNAIGIFYGFMEDDVKLIGIEAGGSDISPGQHAARFSGGRIGIFQGMKTFVLQDQEGQIELTSSISAGLDYAGVGPEHANLLDKGRANYLYVNNVDAMEALKILCKEEGIIPALESAHAIAYVLKKAKEYDRSQSLIVNLSGRGDKDVSIIQDWKFKK